MNTTFLQKSLMLLFILCLNLALNAQPSIKTWQKISTLLDNSVSSARNALKEDGYLFEGTERKGEKVIITFVNNKLKVRDFLVGETSDVYNLIQYEGKTGAVEFNILPINDKNSAITKMMEQYNSFLQSLLNNGFEHIGLLKDEFQNSYFFENKKLAVHVISTETLGKSLPVAYDISVSNNYTYNTYALDDDNDEVEAKRYLKRNPDEKIKPNK